jgi:hypothetical protein
MVMGSAAAPGRRLHDLFARLFDEARGLQRRRHRRYVALALVACVAAAGAGLFGRGGGGDRSSRTGSGAPPQVALVSRAIPALGQSPWLAVAGRRLIVSDTDNLSFAHGRVAGTCGAASVDPVTLRVVSLARGNCGDPALYGERVMPIVYAPTWRAPRGWGANPLAMRIATVDRAAPAGYRLGPIIVTYPDVSDTRAETIQGDRSLWVYAPVTGPRAKLGELLRISETTGRIVERWRMPQVDRALLATNANGLWLGPSNESGFPTDASPSQKLAVESLYRVTPGMRSPERVFDVGQDGARWLVANDQSVWLAVGRPSGTPALWRFEGPTATPTVRAAATLGGFRQCGDLGEGSATVLGSANGIYCVNDPGPQSQGVYWLGASGGRSTVVASVSSSSGYEFMDNAVMFRGSYYFIDPPTSPVSYPSPSGSIGQETSGGQPAILYRVAPR